MYTSPDPVQQALSGFGHPLVRDLAWVLLAPPLLQLPPTHCQWLDRAWCASRFETYRHRLADLERRPAALEQAVSAARDKRLGNYVESLLAFWLAEDPRYELLCHDLPVRQDTQTLGEFDFIVRNREHDTVEHWEVAMKFYLGVGDRTSPAAWLGPGLRDRLDSKTEHLLARQTRLSEQPAGRAALAARGLRIDAVRVLMKGRLFHPLGETRQDPLGATPDHCRGWWARGDDWHARPRDPDMSWHWLRRDQWLAPLTGQGPGLPADAVLAQTAELTHPLCLVGCLHGEEVSRGFLVPRHWPEASRVREQSVPVIEEPAP